MSPTPRSARAARRRPTCEVEARLWRRGIALVAGIDEVGVGPLAGPVVAAAVVLPQGCVAQYVDDSKRLSPRQRQVAMAWVTRQALGWALGACGPAEIDTLGIFEATRVAKRRAVRRLSARLPGIGHALVDGLWVSGLGLPQTAIVGGDGLCASIAAASVMAKVARDGFMTAQERRHPGYAFGRHKGYGTVQHLQALAALGPCALHRHSFRPVALAAGAGQEA